MERNCIFLFVQKVFQFHNPQFLNFLLKKKKNLTIFGQLNLEFFEQIRDFYHGGFEMCFLTSAIFDKESFEKFWLVGLSKHFP